MHVLVRERPEDGSFPITPEDPGLPVAILYGPNAIIRLRKQTPHASQVLPTFGDCVHKLYQGRIRLTEQLRTSEWDMIGSLGNDSLSGVISAYHRLQAPPESLPMVTAYSLGIRESGLKTQNHDKGMDRFVREFDPDQEMSATVSISKVCHCDHGLAVYCKQGSRRCCLLDTMFGLTEEEAPWTALSSWATYQPRRAKPRNDSGRVFH
jgi:hypothetical protein